MMLGLYWGEGTKSNRHSVRLGNSDPALVKAFLSCLEDIYDISRHDFRFGLQVFEDTDVSAVVGFWREYLDVPERHFYKTMIKPKRGRGTYSRLVEYGVLTVYFNNMKLRNVLVQNIEKLRKIDIMSSVLIEQLNRPM